MIGAQCTFLGKYLDRQLLFMITKEIDSSGLEESNMIINKVSGKNLIKIKAIVLDQPAQKLTSEILTTKDQIKYWSMNLIIKISSGGI